eukprot:CAMPEP_0182864178 /NCGR_PEP_ID=MMETSP0034_2-20130328/7033_1 /TAXON_ID=156128 /ORGANISM="Nephroselmis pyriformis, Strain CCMP717" /LENGTH=1484 /DNA_ID=CAMNT_0024996427 /DNA_START=210 /DNA_END=4661 /DNA_ORIENTATION=+
MSMCGGVARLLLCTLMLATVCSSLPTWTGQYPRVTAIGDTTFTLAVQANEVGTAYYVLLAANSTAPTTAEVVAGSAAGGGVSLACGSMSVPFSNAVVTRGVVGVPSDQCGTTTTTTIVESSDFYGLDGLTTVVETGTVMPTGPLCDACPLISASSMYDLYVVFSGASGSQLLPARVELTMGAVGAVGILAPVYTSNFPLVTNVGGDSFKIEVQQDVAGTMYWVVLPNGASVPTSDEVKASAIVASPTTVAGTVPGRKLLEASPWHEEVTRGGGIMLGSGARRGDSSDDHDHDIHLRFGDDDVAVPHGRGLLAVPTAIVGGSFTVPAATVTEFTVASTLLQISTPYDSYFVSEYTAADATTYLQAYPWRIDFTTSTPSNPTTTLTVGPYGVNTNRSSIPIYVQFSGEITGFETTDINVAGGSADNITNLGNGRYTVNIRPTTTAPTVLTVQIPANSVQDARYPELTNTASNVLTMNYDGVRPTVGLTVVTDESPWWVTVQGFFQERVFGFTESALEASGLTLVAGSFSTASSLASTSFTANFTILENVPVTLKVKEGAVTDLFLNTNVESNTLTLPTVAYYAGDTVWRDEQLQNETVPWTKKLCLTPDDIQTGFVFSGENDFATQYSYFEVFIDEINAARIVAQGGRTHRMFLDGETISCRYPGYSCSQAYYPELPVGSKRTLSFRFQPFELNPNGTGQAPFDTVPLTGDVHTLTLYLDYFGRNISFSLGIGFCGFNITGFKCGCAADLDALPGVMVGPTLVPWFTNDTCITPSDQTTYLGRKGFQLEWYESAASAFFGLSAARRGYTTAQNFVSTLYYDSNTTILDVAPAAVTLSAGEQRINRPFFVPPKIDGGSHDFRAELDMFDAVRETDEDNYYWASFKYCWPPDISPGSIFFLGRPDITRQWGGVEPICVYPEDLNPGSNSTDAWFNFTHYEINAGILATGAGWSNLLTFDGQEVMNVGGRPAIEGQGDRNFTRVINLGGPDALVHTLTLKLDSTDVETTEDNTNNEVSVQVKFCGFGADLDAGEYAIVGLTNQVVPWGGTVCLTEADYVEMFFNEVGGLYFFPMTFLEANIGDSLALGGYTNHVLFDNRVTLQLQSRPELVGGWPANSSAARNISVEAPQGVILGSTNDWNDRTHKLDLKYDAYSSLAFELNTNNTWSFNILFCIYFRGLANCGCPADLFTDLGIVVGKKTITFSETTPVCLEPSDLNPDGVTFPVFYYENNNADNTMRPIRGGYRNRLTLDGTILSTTKLQPALPKGEVRGPIAWDTGDAVNGVSFGAIDGVVHTLRFQMDVDNIDYKEVSELNNNYEVQVQYCGFDPDLDAGEGVTIGNRFVPWGGIACLDSNDISVFGFNEGVIQGLDVTYTERNQGFYPVQAGFANRVEYGDDVQMNTVVLDENRPLIGGKSSRSVTHDYTRPFNANQGFTIVPNRRRNQLCVQLDFNDVVREVDEVNRWCVDVWFGFLLTGGTAACPKAPPPSP